MEKIDYLDFDKALVGILRDVGSEDQSWQCQNGEGLDKHFDTVCLRDGAEYKYKVVFCGRSREVFAWKKKCGGIIRILMFCREV